MAQANGKRRRRGRVLPQIVATIRRRAFVHAIKVTGVSHQGAANEMGCPRYTVQRYLSGKRRVNEDYVYSSERIGHSYHVCVGKLMRQAWRASR